MVLYIFTNFSLRLNFSYNDNINDKLINSIDLKTSDYWDLPFKIFIDDSNPNYNWSKTTSDNDWCSGSGTYSDPYVIENVTINGGRTGNVVLIQNSNVFFKFYSLFYLNGCFFFRL